VSAHRIRGSLLLGLSILSALGAVCLGPIGTARADGLVSFEISTGGRAVQAFMDDGTGARSAEAEIPESTADLRAGPVGRAFSSIVWPGPIAGNLGSLLRVLQPSLPPTVTALNDPIRAQATTGQNPPTSTLSLPDVTMTATASDQLVEARATVGTLTAESGPTSGFSSYGSASLRNGAPSGSASASASGVSLAAGLLKIGAVTSTASASSDGNKGAGTASTVVAGLSVAGVELTVDDHGLHLGATGVALNGMINRLADELLASAGIQVALGVPTRTVNGASATMVAPALVVTIKLPSGVLGLVLGGAQASVSGVADTSAQPTLGGATLPAASTGASSSVLPISSGAGPSSAFVGSQPDVVPSRLAAVPAPVSVGTTLPIVDGGRRLRGGAVALALLSAALVAGGLGQLFVATIGRRDDECLDEGLAR
jgi:hypothetical protein